MLSPSSTLYRLSELEDYLLGLALLKERVSFRRL